MRLGESRATLAPCSPALAPLVPPRAPSRCRPTAHASHAEERGAALPSSAPWRRADQTAGSANRVSSCQPQGTGDHKRRARRRAGIRARSLCAGTASRGAGPNHVTEAARAATAEPGPAVTAATARAGLAALRPAPRRSHVGQGPHRGFSLADVSVRRDGSG